MVGIERSKVPGEKRVVTTKNDRTMREFALIGGAATKRPTLALGCDIATKLRTRTAFSYEAYIAPELASHTKTPLDSVPMPATSTQYEKDIMSAYREQTDPGFLERGGHGQRTALNSTGKPIETRSTLETQLLNNIANHGETPAPEMSDAEFEDLVADM